MHRSNFFFTITLLLLTLALSVTPSLAQKPSSLLADPSAVPDKPGQIVIETIAKGLEILQDPSLQDMDKFVERRQKLWDAIKPVFNFEETSRRALGRHWKDLTEKQRTEFVHLFRGILRDIYLGKSDSYAGEKIIYLRESIRGKRCKVQTTLITSDQKEISVDFTLKQTSDTWRIYDVIIEGVSIVSNYRSQFNSILTSSTFEDLMEKLREKEKELNVN